MRRKSWRSLVALVVSGPVARERRLRSLQGKPTGHVEAQVAHSERRLVSTRFGCATWSAPNARLGHCQNDKEVGVHGLCQSHCDEVRGSVIEFQIVQDP